MKRPKTAKLPARRRVRIGERQIETIGQKEELWADFYHHAMTVSTTTFIFGALALFFFNNLLFAALFDMGKDPVANVGSPELLYLFFFSIENFTTVGFGDMHPQSIYAHSIASIEGFVALIQTAALTGLIFARFSRPRARIMFASNPVIARHDGEQTLMIRMGNERHNTITDAKAELWVLRLENSKEGQRFRRIHRLDLFRQENPNFVLTWTLFHTITPDSLLYNKSVQNLAEDEYQFIVTVRGIDDTSSQELRSRKTYPHDAILWGQRYQDIILNQTDGSIIVDYSKFDQTVKD